MEVEHFLLEQFPFTSRYESLGRVDLCRDLSISPPLPPPLSQMLSHSLFRQGSATWPVCTVLPVRRGWDTKL